MKVTFISNNVIQEPSKSQFSDSIYWPGYWPGISVDVKTRRIVLGNHDFSLSIEEGKGTIEQVDYEVVRVGSEVEATLTFEDVVVHISITD